MFGINLNAVSLLSTVALGPAGGIGIQLAQQVFASMGQQLLQGFGQGLNLPQETISLAQDTFSGAGVGASIEGHASLQDSVAAAGAKAGLSPTEIGDQQRQVSDFVNNTIKQAQESDEYNEVKASGKGGGWLMAMAKALGAQLDQLGDEMTDMASRITKDTPGLSAEFGVVTQQFSMLMNATTNAIKTVGEAMGKAASRN